MTKQFRTDNTEGYSEPQLAVLNQRFETEIAAFGDLTDDLIRKTVTDFLAQRILADFDAQQPA